MKNNYAFIDGQNLHFGIKSMGWKLDHKKFRSYLEKEHDVTKAYIFLGFMEEHQDLYNVLQEAGFICFFKPLVRYDDGTIKGNVDADMVLQVMVDIENYDGAVIISGDGDFSGTLRHLIYRRKLGQVIIPNRDKYSSLFDRLEDFDEKHVTFMNDLRSKLSYNVGKKPFHPRKRPDNRGDKTPAAGGSAAGKQPSATTSKPAHNKPSRPARRQNSRPNNSPKPKRANDYKPKAQVEKSLIDTINGE